MKSLFFVLTAAAALAAPKILCKSDSCCSAYPCTPESQSELESAGTLNLSSAQAPRGRYLEARTASVYAGACHYGGERVSNGRRAAVGFHFEGGQVNGVALAGLSVGALVSAADNLDEDRASRRSVVYVPERATADEAEALEAWMRSEHGDLLGDIAEVRTVPVRFQSEGESYSMRMGSALRLEGSLMPNRECCKMPFGRWYEPLADGVQDSIVGCSSTFRADEPLLEADFGRAEQNDAYIGSFGTPAS